MDGDTKKTGRVNRGWIAAKSAWTVLKLDKELSVFTLISFIACALIIGAALAIISFGLPSNTPWAVDTSYTSNNKSQLLVYLGALLAIGLVGIYTTAAVVAAALIRYRGGDPTLRDGLSAVRKRFGSLTLYGVFYITVGQILRILEERIPFIGAKIVALLADILWSAANIFSIPVIVESEHSVSPLQAVKGSVNVIKKTWAESVVGQISISLIFVALVALEMIVGIFGATLFASSSLSAVSVVLGILTGLAVLTTIIIASTLSGIIKAALYYYAITGEAPEHFSKELLHQAFTKRKARKLFS
jgi:hypothetical protein